MRPILQSVRTPHTDADARVHTPTRLMYPSKKVTIGSHTGKKCMLHVDSSVSVCVCACVNESVGTCGLAQLCARTSGMALLSRVKGGGWDANRGLV